MTIAQKLFPVALILCLASCSHTPADTARTASVPPAKPYELPGTQVFTFASKETGNTYNVTVSLPGSYANAAPDQRFPVLYVLDAQWQFPLLYTASGAVNYDGDMPDTILVGISWQDSGGNLMALRDQDLTPTATTRAPHAGHAQAFQAFFKNELFPYIEQRYAVNQHRTVTGGSTSALFVYYTLLSQPELFDGYIASSPSVYWDDYVIEKILANFPKDGIKRPTRAYLSAGALEMSDAVASFARHLADKQLQNLEFRYAEVNNSGHAAVNAECYTRGMQFVYRKADISLSKADLHKLTGTFSSVKEKYDVTFSGADGRLYIFRC